MSKTIVELLDRPQVTVDPRLLNVAETKMLLPARRAGVELVPVGVTGPPRHEVVHSSEWGSWVFNDHLHDPTAFAYNGRIPIPEAQVRVLQELDRHGVSPDLVWIGHQVPDGWRLGDPVPVPSPRALRERDARLIKRLKLATTAYVVGAAALLAAAATPGLAAMAVGAGMDPVILGGVWDACEEHVAWCLLAQWNWE